MSTQKLSQECDLSVSNICMLKGNYSIYKFLIAFKKLAPLVSL